MAFPGTYNFAYYRGDTFEFRVYPKNSSGQIFSLANYEASFTVAAQRGPSGEESQITSYAEISPDGSHINCALLNSDGLNLNGGQQYVYDVEIRNADAQPYPIVYTLLTGNITVQDQVTNVELNPTQIPNAPTVLVVTEDPAGTLNMSWTEPELGDAPTSYNVYAKVSTDTEYTLLGNSETNSFSTASIGEGTFQTGLTYNLDVRSVNVAGENSTDTLSGNVTIA